MPVGLTQVFLYIHLNYVAIVLPTSTPTSGTLPTSATTQTTDTSSGSVNGFTDLDAARVVLVDMENKMIAYIGVFEIGVPNPLCARQHGVIQEIRRNNVRLADQHDLFLAEVKESGFRVV